MEQYIFKSMLKSITEDNNNLLIKQAEIQRIKRSQIVQIVPNQNGSVSLFYWQDYEK